MKQEHFLEDLPQSNKDQISDLFTFVIPEASYPIFLLKSTLSKLHDIKNRLQYIQSKMHKKGLCGFIKISVSRRKVAASLQQCVSDLDSEMEVFHVRSI